MVSKKKVQKGHRIAHRELDEDIGTARVGVAEDVIGEEEGARLVIAQFEDTGELEAYDEREVVDLGKADASSGPVIVRPRHLLVLFKNRPAAIALLFVLVVGLVLNVSAYLYEWGLITVALLSAGVLGLSFFIFSLLLSQSNIEQQKTNHS